VLFLPLVFGIHSLYTWYEPPAASGSRQGAAAQGGIPERAVFPGPRGALLRHLASISYFFNKWSIEQDSRGAEPFSSRLQGMAGPSLLLYGATVTFSSIDWVMSLDPHWFSTIYGILFIGGQGGLRAFVRHRRDRAGGLAAAHVGGHHRQTSARPGHAAVRLHHAGGAYFNFSQFLLIWGGQPAGGRCRFTCKRMNSGLQWVGADSGCVSLRAARSCCCLSRQFKRNRRWMAAAAGWVICMRIVDLFWLTGLSCTGWTWPLR